MTIRLVVAVTDPAWFASLRARSFEEINFWAPGNRSFRALEPGELFLFRLHAPHRKIAGGGIYGGSVALPVSLAWKFFGEANGTRSEEELRARLRRYRREAPPVGDFEITCRILTQPFFWNEETWFDAPSWNDNIVSYKRYDTSEREGRALWTQVIERVPLFGADERHAIPRWGTPSLIRPRLGQGGFRARVVDLYTRRCAVTGERTLPALEAAHIRPYTQGGTHEASNGLLLRRDIHGLFDEGYVTVSPDLRFEVSRRIREEFENGKDYYALHGHKVFHVHDPVSRPDPDALRWHNERVFKG